MARFHSNENIALQVVTELRRLGHDVLTPLDAGKANPAVPTRTSRGSRLPKSGFCCRTIVPTFWLPDSSLCCQAVPITIASRWGRTKGYPKVHGYQDSQMGVGRGGLDSTRSIRPYPHESAGDQGAYVEFTGHKGTDSPSLL